MQMTTAEPAPARGRSRGVRWAAAFTALCMLAVLAVLASAPAAGATAARQPEAPPAAATDQVLFIGVSGLAWEDVDPVRTPALWSLVEGSAIGSLVVRSVRPATCPADGWLALNTGTRAADRPGLCRTLTEPRGGAVPGLADYEENLADQSFGAQLGVLPGALAETGVRATSIGPGAALALTDQAGRTAVHRDRPPAGPGLTDGVAGALAGSDLVVVDAGSLREARRGIQGTPEAYHADQMRVIERRVAAILEGMERAGTDPAVVLAGLSDSGSEAGLRVLAIAGTGPGELTSASTRQPGYVLATDPQATVYSLLGVSGQVPAGTTLGAAARPSDSGADAGQLVAAADDREAHAQAVKPLVARFFLLLVVLNLALYAVVAVGLKRPTMARLVAWWRRRFPAGSSDRTDAAETSDAESAWLPSRVGVLRVLRVVALAIGALPVSSFLANLLPWWRADPPALALAGATAGWMAVLVMLSLVGPWRRTVLGSGTVIAAITATVIGVDIITGAHLQISAIMGVPTLVAGRFYGMNNTAFALFSVSLVIVTMSLANPLVRRGRRGLAGLVTIAVGIVATVIDGAPGLGADFGGPPALLPAFAILALMAAGVRLSWKRVLAVLGGAAAATIGIAFLDWLRPEADQTHLGRFFQTLLDGGLWTVIYRKADQNLTILFNNRPLTLLAIFGVLTVIFVLSRPIKGAINEPSGGRFSWLSSGAPISRMSEQAPMLGPGITAMAIAAALGLAVNDSGIAIPALFCALAVPVLIAACATWMLGLTRRDGVVIYAS